MGSSTGVVHGLAKEQPRKFRLFISYAREDAKVANAVGNALKEALGRSAEVFIDAGLRVGANFQDEIKRRLDETDVLVVIESTVLKPAFAFPGLELGYFMRVMNQDVDRDFTRRIVPVFFDKPPEALADYHGIKIGISHATLGSSLEAFEACSENRIDWRHPTVVFLRDLQVSVDHVHEKYDGKIPRDEDEEDVPAIVKRMQLAIFSQLRTNPEFTAKPQKQITIRTNDTALKRSKGFELPDDAIIYPVGNGIPLSIFGLDSIEMTMSQFRERTKEAKYRDSWIDAITSVVTSSLQNQLEADNSQIVVSNDEARAYRVILTTGTKYFNGDREFNLYFVEYLKRRDFGDRKTTLLLKGLELFCRFRFMFLEQTSEFSRFGVKSAKSLPEFARHLESELNLLRRDSMELSLDKPHEIAALVNWDLLEKMIAVWRPLEVKLRGVIGQIRNADEAAMEELRASLVDVMHELEESVLPLNIDAVTEMAERLKQALATNAER
jgi:hypothetical protein